MFKNDHPVTAFKSSNFPGALHVLWAFHSQTHSIVGADPGTVKQSNARYVE